MKRMKEPHGKITSHTENITWLKDYRYGINHNPLVLYFKNFSLYRKLLQSLNLEDKYLLSQYIKFWGFHRGVKLIVMDIKLELSTRDYAKHREMEKQLAKEKADEAFIQKSINEQLEEEQYEQGLTSEEVLLRNKVYPGGIMKIPENILFRQQVIDSGERGDIKYYIFNKVYGCWSAAITSPHREKPDGTKGCVILRDQALGSLRTFLNTEIIKEKDRQEEFMRLRNKKPNINRIQQVMGINRNVNSDLDNDDIF